MKENLKPAFNTIQFLITLFSNRKLFTRHQAHLLKIDEIDKFLKSIKAEMSNRQLFSMATG